MSNILGATFTCILFWEHNIPIYPWNLPAFHIFSIVCMDMGMRMHAHTQIYCFKNKMFKVSSPLYINELEKYLILISKVL